MCVADHRFVQEQQQKIQHLQDRLPELHEALVELSTAEDDCQAANVDENDYTVFTYQDLEFEHELLVQSLSKKIAFIDNQVRQIFTTLRHVLSHLNTSHRRLCRGT